MRPNSLDFGNTLINTTAKQTVMLTDKCNYAVAGIAAQVEGGDANLFTVDEAPVTLGAGQSATVDIGYSPLALETRSLADVTFDGSGGERATLTLFGEPIACALTLAPNRIDLGYVVPGSSGLACTTLSNQCTIAVTLTQVDFSLPDGPFSLSQTDGTPLPATISGGESAKICFSYTALDSGQLPSETVTFVLEGWNGPNPSTTLTL